MKVPWVSLVGTAVFAAGLFWLQASALRWVCAPLSPWQGHAVWHVLCAGVVGMLFFHCDTMCQPLASLRPTAAVIGNELWK